MIFKAALASWMALILIGFGLSMKWSLTPGESIQPPTGLRSSDKTQVDAIIHPLCPCSRASLHLLEKAVRGSEAEITFYFVGQSTESENVSIAKRIPNATLTFISESECAKKFGNATSGQIFLHKGKRLLYSGGLTDSRGEEATGSAYQAFTERLTGKGSLPATLPTFGCPVQTP